MILALTSALRRFVRSRSSSSHIERSDRPTDARASVWPITPQREYCEIEKVLVRLDAGEFDETFALMASLYGRVVTLPLSGFFYAERTTDFIEGVEACLSVAYRARLNTRQALWVLTGASRNTHDTAMSDRTQRWALLTTLAPQSDIALSCAR